MFGLVITQMIKFNGFILCLVAINIGSNMNS